jgi:hypothetical protein
MFERYNEPARRSLFFSRYEAALLASLTIETEHLLLGIVKDRDPLITHLLGGRQSLDDIRRLVYERAGQPGSPIDVSVHVPFSEDVTQVLQYTAEEASRLLHSHIGCEHLLLGLLRLDRGVAFDVLREKGLSLTRVREALVLHVNATSQPPAEIATMISGMLPRGNARAHVSPDVYMLTALDGPHPGRRPAADEAGKGVGGSFGMVGFSTPANRPPDDRIHSIGPITMSGTTIAGLALVLEGFLGRPVFDDTGITGTCDIELTGEYHTEETLTAALRDQLGLELTRSL